MVAPEIVNDSSHCNSLCPCPCVSTAGPDESVVVRKVREAAGRVEAGLVGRLLVRVTAAAAAAIRRQAVRNSRERSHGARGG